MKFVDVIIINSPITRRMVRSGMEGKIDTETKHIQVNGLWFEFKESWKVLIKDQKYLAKIIDINDKNQIELLIQENSDLSANTSEDYYISFSKDLLQNVTIEIDNIVSIVNFTISNATVEEIEIYNKRWNNTRDEIWKDIDASFLK